MIIVSPTDEWLKPAFGSASGSVTISSPYVGDYLSKAILGLSDEVKVRLLTKTLLSDFASRASDLDAVQRIAERAGGIYSLSSLHAKVYVIGTNRALVTSANATFSGMYRNRECGVEITDNSEVGELRALVQSGFGVKPAPKLWSSLDLEELREPVEALRATLPKVVRKQPAPPEAAPFIRLRRREFASVVSTFGGWLRLTLDGISQLPPETFTMDDVFRVCAPLAVSMFPTNQHVREKLRQQMQRLRDLGLVNFVERGRYQLLMLTR